MSPRRLGVLTRANEELHPRVRCTVERVMFFFLLLAQTQIIATFRPIFFFRVAVQGMGVCRCRLETFNKAADNSRRRPRLRTSTLKSSTDSRVYIFNCVWRSARTSNTRLIGPGHREQKCAENYNR